jgi:cathepsin C
MNQGCDGGYGYLIGRWATEEYLVPEAMEPYTAKDGDCNTHAAEGLSTVYGVGEFGYIGGAYGQNTEESIMRELYEGGPVVMNFEPNYDFMFYE